MLRSVYIYTSVKYLKHYLNQKHKTQPMICETLDCFRVTVFFVLLLLFVCFFLCFLLFFVFVVVIFCYVSFIVSEVKLFVRHTLCGFFQLHELIADRL